VVNVLRAGRDEGTQPSRGTHHAPFALPITTLSNESCALLPTPDIPLAPSPFKVFLHSVYPHAFLPPSALPLPRPLHACHPAERLFRVVTSLLA
jgi:hypothetical protein